MVRKSNFCHILDLQAMGVWLALSMAGSVSHALRISEISESEFWNILEHSTATV